METNPEILSYSQRRYEEIPIDQIKVINSRNREQKQFDRNVLIGMSRVSKRLGNPSRFESTIGIKKYCK